MRPILAVGKGADQADIWTAYPRLQSCGIARFRRGPGADLIARLIGI